MLDDIESHRTVRLSYVLMCACVPVEIVDGFYLCGYLDKYCIKWNVIGYRISRMAFACHTISKGNAE